MKVPILNMVEQARLDDARMAELMADGAITRSEAWEIVTVRRRISLLTGMEHDRWRKELLAIFLKD